MNLNEIFIPFLLTLIAGLSTILGSFIFLFRNFCQRRFLGFFLGLSAGVMIYLSFVELLPFAIENMGFLQGNVFFFIGILLMALIDFFIPHNYLKEKACKNQKVIDSKLLSVGTVVALGLIIHNFPEGMAVFLGSFVDIKLGLLLALAIAVHNIPEGIAVSAPIYHATGNKKKAIKYAFIAGIAEPMGAIIAYLFLRPYFNQGILALVFALVAGIMVYISFDELLPACFRDENAHHVISGIVTGMIIVAFSLLFL